MKRLLFAAASVCAVASPALAEEPWEELTDTFIPAFEHQAVGTAEAVGWTEYDSKCLAKVPLTDTCLHSQRSRAKGSLQITSVLAHSGRILRRMESNPITGSSSREFAANLHFEFAVSGETTAETYTDNVLTDYPWGELHPGGRVQVWLEGEDGKQFELLYRFEADPGHDDRPNLFLVQHVAQNLKPRLADEIRSLLGNPNMKID